MSSGTASLSEKIAELFSLSKKVDFDAAKQAGKEFSEFPNIKVEKNEWNPVGQQGVLGTQGPMGGQGPFLSSWSSSSSGQSCCSSAINEGAISVVFPKEGQRHLKELKSIFDDWWNLEIELRKLMGHNDDLGLESALKQMDSHADNECLTYMEWKNTREAMILMIRDRMNSVMDLVLQKNLPAKLEGLSEPNINGTKFKYLMVE